MIPSTDHFSEEQKHTLPHAIACTLKELENQGFQNKVKEQEVYHPHDTDIFDITKRDPDYCALLPFLVSLYPAIVESSKHCANACTSNILNLDAPTIYQSLVHPDTPDDYTLCASMFVGEIAIHNDIINDNNHNRHPFIKYQCDFTIVDESKPAGTLNNDDTSQKAKSDNHSSPMFNPEEFIGLSFLINKQEDGRHFRGSVVQITRDHESLVNNNPTKINFLVSINEDQAEENITFNEMSNYIFKDDKIVTMWKIYQVVSYQVPMQLSHPENNGSQYKVVIKWDNGEITNELLYVIDVDDPVICESYAQDNDLSYLNIIMPCTYHEEDGLSHTILTSELEWDPYIWHHDFEPDSQCSEISFIDKEFDDASDHTNRDLEGDTTLSHSILTSEVEWDPYIWYHDFEVGDECNEISFIDTKYDDAGGNTNMDVLKLEELFDLNANSSHGSNANFRAKDSAFPPDKRRDKNWGESFTPLNPCKNYMLYICDSQPGFSKCENELPTLFLSTNVYDVNIYRVHDRGKAHETKKAVSIQFLQNNYLQFTPVT